MSEQALAEYCCPYAEKDTLSKFIKEGRKCKISGELCFNWFKYEAVLLCRTKIDHDREAQKEETTT